MQNLKRKKEAVARQFRVGVVGASDAAFAVISRIFHVTACRNRHYLPVKIDGARLERRADIELVLMCSANPTIICAWEKFKFGNTEQSVPLIYLSRADAPKRGQYQLSAPVNPSKLIKLLDQFTIKELNFFPEFEIGDESGASADAAASGLRLLRANQSQSDDRSKSDKRGKALIVDDSLAVRRQMQLEFELRAADLDVAANAEQALAAIRRTKYDIIFLDVVMPGVDGYTVCKKIKRCPVNKATPVVMLTSRSGSFDKIKGTLAGCDAYMVKPINHNEFETLYNKHVWQHHASQQHLGVSANGGQ